MDAPNPLPDELRRAHVRALRRDLDALERFLLDGDHRGAADAAHGLACAARAAEAEALRHLTGFASPTIRVRLDFDDAAIDPALPALLGIQLQR